jgi:hypothetical protein
MATVTFVGESNHGQIHRLADCPFSTLLVNTCIMRASAHKSSAENNEFVFLANSKSDECNSVANYAALFELRLTCSWRIDIEPEDCAQI